MFLKTKFYQGFPANTAVPTTTAKQIYQPTYFAFVNAPGKMEFVPFSCVFGTTCLWQ